MGERIDSRHSGAGVERFTVPPLCVEQKFEIRSGKKERKTPALLKKNNSPGGGREGYLV